MKPWKKFQYWVADYLGWEYITKKHYGYSCPDVREKKKDGFVGECKHHKKFAIHTLKQKTDLLYKDDIIIFTKVKGTHYEPHNVLVAINIELFKNLLECKRIAEKTPPPKVKTKPSTKMIYKIRAIRQLFREIEKMIKSKGG